MAAAADAGVFGPTDEHDENTRWPALKLLVLVRTHSSLIAARITSESRSVPEHGLGRATPYRPPECDDKVKDLVGDNGRPFAKS